MAFCRACPGKSVFVHFREEPPAARVATFLPQLPDKGSIGDQRRFQTWLAATPACRSNGRSDAAVTTDAGASSPIFARGSRLPIPDHEFYQPTFSPWLGYGEFRGLHERASRTSLVGPDRCYVLYCLAKQAIRLPGEYWECGVYKGGTASMLAEILFRQNRRPLRLFDTFSGMPATDPSYDLHSAGDFGDTSLEAVRLNVGHDEIVSYHQGLIPDTFNGLEDSAICFAHVDVDIHRSVLDCCAFIYPRLVRGGFMVFDDYGFDTCPGAKAAVDQFFQGTGIVPLVLATGQALVFKSFA